MITLYGIKNCDTMKKTWRKLDALNLDWRLHDYRKDGIDPALCETLLAHIPLELLINRRGSTWRTLSQAQQQDLAAPGTAVQLMCEHPALIKRPVIQTSTGQWLAGPDAIAALDNLRN